MEIDKVVSQTHFVLRDKKGFDIDERETLKALEELKAIDDEYSNKLDEWIEKYRFFFIDWTGESINLIKGIKLMHCSICTKRQHYWNGYCKSCKYYYNNDKSPLILEEEE